MGLRAGSYLMDIGLLRIKGYEEDLRFNDTLVIGMSAWNGRRPAALA
jgi:hypothetical protein